METLSYDFLQATMTYLWAPRFSDQVEELGLSAWPRTPDGPRRGVVPSKSLLRAKMARMYAIWGGRVDRAFDFLDIDGLGFIGFSTNNNELLFYLYSMGLPVPSDRMEHAFVTQIDSTAHVIDIFSAATFAVDQGRFDDFDRLLELLNDPRYGGRRSVLMGYRAWREGNVDGAIPLLESGYPSTRVALWWLGNVYLDAGRWEDAQRVFNTSSWPNAFESFRYEPLVQQRLGQAYEAQGKLDEAIESYNYFLEHWADADPELQPLVEETRDRLEAILDQQG